jgi:hypothetical protein
MRRNTWLRLTKIRTLFRRMRNKGEKKRCKEGEKKIVSKDKLKENNKK